MRIRSWLAARRPTKRRLIQLYAALLFNANLRGLRTGRLYDGPAKGLCVPGLNCYSCPAAAGACPLGALQSALGASNRSSLSYVGGILLLYGLLFGRFVCGFLCPFGLIQELLYKVKAPKLRKNRVTGPILRALSSLKYLLLVFLALLLPLAYARSGLPVPAFCKYLCPAGTLEGALALLFHPRNGDLLPMLGPLFTWKFAFLAILLAGCVFIFRPFCRFLCPLGALYGLFNRFSIAGVRLDRDACTRCGRCRAVCGMDIRLPGDRECIQCGECLDVCPVNAISLKGPAILLQPQAVGGEIRTRRPGDPSPSPERAAARRRTRRRAVQVTAAVLMLLLLVGALLLCNLPGRSRGAPSAGNRVGDRLYGASLVPLRGGGAFDPADQRGRIVVLNFWGTWCGPCVAELPTFDRIASAYADAAVVAAVHSDYLADDAADWVERHYPTSAIRFCRDGGDAYYRQLGGRGTFPMTVIAGADGVILYVRQGRVSEGELRTVLDKALARTGG